jgi:hypothetical protein
MATWIWNGLGWTHKDKQIAELRAENAKSKRLFDETLQRNCELDVQIILLQSAHDDLIARNEKLASMGVEYRDSAERLKKERDESKLRLDDCLTKICKLHDRVAVFENAIRTAVSIAGL